MFLRFLIEYCAIRWMKVSASRPNFSALVKMMISRYGMDAPLVVRNLFLFACVALVLAMYAFQIKHPIWFWVAFLYAGAIALSLFFSGCWMLYSMWVSKPKIAIELIEDLALQGDEKILDLGCGSGILLIEAAKRLPQGKAHGIDLWQTKDQSGNRMEKTLSKAEAEGVTHRIEIETGDIRSLPYPDGTFDAVVSSLVIHNIRDEQGREQALKEMLRVLKPGGRFALVDLHYGKKYASFLNTVKTVEAVSASTGGYFYCPPVRIVKGKKSALQVKSTTIP